MKKLVLGFLLSLIALFGIQDATAANWLPLMQMKDGSKVSIDTDSIRSVNDTTYAMWDKTDHEDGSYTVGLSYYSTDRVAMVVISVVEYDKEGNVIGSASRAPYEYDLYWTPIVPGTLGEALYTCATGTLNK